MTYSNLAHCLGNFFTLNKLNKDNYSERCSIHVHTNCLDLTVDQIRTVLFLYQMCEKLLYSWVDPERYDNIFCVPWSQTNLTYQSLSGDGDNQNWRGWRKYTGLNLLPLYEQGTIEWRHMSGHADMNKILEWCQIIGKMYTYSLKNSLSDVRTQLLDLNTNSQYKTMLERIFGDHAPMFYNIPTYEQDLEDGVLNLKYASHTPQDKAKPKKQTIQTIFDDLQVDNVELIRQAIEADRMVRGMQREARPRPPQPVPRVRPLATAHFPGPRAENNFFAAAAPVVAVHNDVEGDTL
jgi:hypothetical protein